jgi:hypothetical protein
MGNFLSTEEMGEEEEQHGGEERMKVERKKRKARAKTAKRRAAAAAAVAPPVSLETEGFGYFSDPTDSLERREGRKENEFREEEELEPPNMDVWRNTSREYEDEPVSKPKRRKRGGATVSRRKRIAWDDEGDEY